MGNIERFYEFLKGIIVNFRVKTCCCIVPLKVGILYLAYFNLAFSLLLIIGTASESFESMATHVQKAINEDASSISTCILPPVTDLAFSVVLICAMHRNDLVLLRVYCWYGVAAILASALTYSLIIPQIKALHFVIIILSLVYQGYVIILVRSVMVEIRLANAAAKSDLYYDKHKDTVTVRDVEKAEEVISKGVDKEQVVEPKVEEVIETVEPSVSKSSTLKKDAQTSTRIEPGSWRTTFLTVNRPAAKIDTTETPAEPSTSKDVSKDDAKSGNGKDDVKIGNSKEDSKTTKDDKETKIEDTKIDVKKTETTDSEVLEANEAPQKKKRGLFRRTPKENKKKDDNKT